MKRQRVKRCTRNTDSGPYEEHDKWFQLLQRVLNVHKSTKNRTLCSGGDWGAIKE